MKETMRNEFRITGIGDHTNHVSSDTNNVKLVSQPGAGKHIVIVDIMSKGGSSLIEGDDSTRGSDVICYFGPGIGSLNSPIKVKANTAVWSGSGEDMTFTYYITEA